MAFAARKPNRRQYVIPVDYANFLPRKRLNWASNKDEIRATSNKPWYFLWPRNAMPMLYWSITFIHTNKSPTSTPFNTWLCFLSSVFSLLSCVFCFRSMVYGLFQIEICALVVCCKSFIVFVVFLLLTLLSFFLSTFFSVCCAAGFRLTSINIKAYKLI